MWGERAALGLLVLAACACPGGGSERAAPATAGSREPATPETPNVPDAPDAPDAPIPASARQLLVGVSRSWTAVDLELHWFERGAGGWVRIGEPWRGAAGAAGLGWGHGLHGDGAPDGQPGPVKREGDLRSPAGAFAVTASYGYADEAPEGARLGYVRVSDSWRCVDDPDSAAYNRVFDSAGVARDWRSAERMRRRDGVYEWVIEIAHNRAGEPAAGAGGPEPGAGSCIFFHVWSGRGAATAGCTAMTRERMVALVGGLDPSAVYVSLPRDRYQALREPWGLPAL